MNLMLNSFEGWFLVVDSTILLLSLAGNCLALQGVWNTRFRLMGYRRFLISLVVGDLFLICVHLCDKVNQILVAESMARCCRCATFVIRSLLLSGVFVNLFNLCGMSVDHYIGIVYPLRYRYMMRKSLARWVLLFIWVGAFIAGFGDTPILAAMYLNEPTSSSSHISPEFSGSLIIPTFMSTPRSKSGSKHDPSALPEQFDIAIRRRGRKNSSSSENFIIPLMLPNVIEGDVDILFGQSSTTDELQRFSSSSARPKIVPRQSISDIRNRSLGFYREQQTNWCLYFGSRKKWLEIVSGLCVLLSFVFIASCYGKTFNLASTALNSRSIRKLTLTTCLLLGVFALCWLPFALVELVMGLSALKQFTQAHSDILLIVHKIFYTIFLLNRLFDPVLYVARLPNVQRYLIRRYSSCLPCLKRFAAAASNDDRFLSERTNNNNANNNYYNAAAAHDRLTPKCSLNASARDVDVMLDDAIVLAQQLMSPETPPPQPKDTHGN